MKLPSLSHVIAQSKETAIRFPFTLISALFYTISFWVITERTGDISLPYWDNLGLSSLLGLPLFTGVVLLCERKNIDAKKALVLQSVFFGILLLYAFTLPENVFSAPHEHLIRFLMLNVGLHLFVSFSPFIERGNLNGFWQFNKMLFLRILTALLYSSVLYLGLTVALLAIENLFNIGVLSNWYIRLWYVITGMFNTWFFLGGIPRDLKSLDEEQSYPKGLKVFTQYVLIPLVTIYLLILYAYVIKIFFDWDWPKGWVGYLVLGFSTLGIFSLLLVWPIRNLVENIWINKFTKWFYVTLIPLVALLFFAIFRRISEYGLTEKRTIVLILAFWISGIIAYYLSSKVKSIKVIPISLAIVAFGFSFGPFSVTTVSKNYQLNRLEEELIKYHVLVDGKVHLISVQPPFQDRKQISSIVKYIVETHGAAIFQPWYDAPIDSLKKSDTLLYYDRSDKPRNIVASMGIRYVNEWENKDTQGHTYITSSKNYGFSVEGYRHYFGDITLDRYTRAEKRAMDGTTYDIIFDSLKNSIAVSRIKDTQKFYSVVELDSLFINVTNKYAGQQYANVPSSEMKVSQSTNNMHVTLLITRIDAEKSEKGYGLESISFDLLVGD